MFFNKIISAITDYTFLLSSTSHGLQACFRKEWSLYIKYKSSINWYKLIYIILGSSVKIVDHSFQIKFNKIQLKSFGCIKNKMNKMVSAYLFLVVHNLKSSTRIKINRIEM